jgi:hypothetical protein
MTLIAGKTLFQNSFSTLPLSTYQAGETVIAAAISEVRRQSPRRWRNQ